MEHFLATVCSQGWNRGQDAGGLIADAARRLKEQHADKAELIDAFYGRFDEMMAGPIRGTVEILAELHARGTPLYLLSNFSAETYPLACQRFDFLRLFDGIIVSGEVKAIKPDRRIYEILIERYRIDPHRAVFIDDVAENVAAAQRLGIHGIQFIDPEGLRAELAMLDLL
jgi:2-haloacid dehalogenase